MRSARLTTFAMSMTLAGIVGAHAQGYGGAPRPFLFNPAVKTCIRDTSAFKKKPPYVLAFSNAGLGDSWRVVMLDEMKKGAAAHRDKISKLIITDAGHDDAKQVSDIQDLMSQQPDLLIVSANTEKAIDPAVSRALRRGIPVVLVDRRIQSDNFTTYVAASDAIMGRLWAQWIAEKLHGKGNVVILAGQAGSSPSEDRMNPALEVLHQYPGIHILDTVYSDWSPVKGKQVMQAVIGKYGHSINAVLALHGLQVPGSIEAFLEAGFKPGEIPMHTTADMNGPLQLALKYHIPMLEVGDPPTSGEIAIDVALKVLNGTTVPCTYFVNQQVAVTDGDETPSVHGDLPIKDLVVPDGPSDMLITSDMGKDYNPSTAKIDYPH